MTGVQTCALPISSGVKSIKLKDDEVVASCLFDPNTEYITIITDKGTAKRLKLQELEKTSRANRGLLLMKEIKSNPSKIISCYLIPTKEELVVTSIKESKTIKLTEISIMDRQSNGSFIVKDRIVNTYQIAKLVKENDLKIIDNSNNENIKIINNDKEYISLKNIDDVMNSIEMQLDDIEEN